MKTISRDCHIPGLLIILVLFFVISGCSKTTDAVIAGQENVSEAQAAVAAFGPFVQINLNANKPGYNAPRINPKLHNAWGLSASPGGTFWISAADGGVSF